MILAGSALLCAAIFTGCSNNEEQIDNALAIRLNAGVKTPVTRAAINTGDKFSAGVAGWETDQVSADYATAANWNTTATVTAAATAANVILDKAQFYNPTETTKTFIKAWHPAGKLNEDGTVTFPANADGSVDVMTTTAISGSAKDNGIKNLTFDHKLTQIKFKVVGDATFVSAGIKLMYIRIKDAKLPTGLNLVNNVVTYAAPALFTVPNIDAQPLTDKEVPAGNSVMIEPFAGNTFKADVVTNDGTTDKTYSDVVITIDTDDAFQSGKAYTITLAFGAPGINVSASVTPWTTGTGSGTVKD